MFVLAFFVWIPFLSQVNFHIFMKEMTLNNPANFAPFIFRHFKSNDILTHGHDGKDAVIDLNMQCKLFRIIPAMWNLSNEFHPVKNQNKRK